MIKSTIDDKVSTEENQEKKEPPKFDVLHSSFNTMAAIEASFKNMKNKQRQPVNPVLNPYSIGGRGAYLIKSKPQKDYTKSKEKE